jgi:Tfp pilus assembly PilM family ATPase/Tfp pilus assembly protein PilN
MPKQVLGIELGSQHLAAVQLTGTAKAYEVTAAVHQLLPLRENPADPHEQQQEALESLLNTHRLRGDTVLVTLPAAHAVMRNLTLPFQDPRRIRQVLTYTLDEHMPFDPDDVVADFHVLPAAPTGATPILAAAMPQEIIAGTLDMLHELGLDPSIIDLDVFSLANTAVLGGASQSSNTLLVDVHPARTLLTLLSHRTPIFARSWTYGWPQGDTELETYATRLGKQIQHTIYAYENALQQSYDMEDVVLSGITADTLPNLAHFLRQAIGVPVEPCQLTADTYRGNASFLTTAEHAHTAVAFGAACRGLHRQATGLNLRRERFALHRDLQELRGRLVVVGCLLVVLAGMGIGALYLNTRFKVERLQQLQANIEQVFRSTMPDTRMVQPMFQMEEKVRDIRDRLHAFGGVSGAQLSGLQTLREISMRAPSEVSLNVDSLTIASKTVDLNGVTGSYDDVVKFQGALEASPAFTDVKIISANNESNKVAFKLSITIAQDLDNVS